MTRCRPSPSLGSHVEVTAGAEPAAGTCWVRGKCQGAVGGDGACWTAWPQAGGGASTPRGCWGPDSQDGPLDARGGGPLHLLGSSLRSVPEGAGRGGSSPGRAAAVRAGVVGADLTSGGTCSFPVTLWSPDKPSPLATGASCPHKGEKQKEAGSRAFGGPDTPSALSSLFPGLRPSGRDVACGQGLVLESHLCALSVRNTAGAGECASCRRRRPVPGSCLVHLPPAEGRLCGQKAGRWARPAE